MVVPEVAHEQQDDFHQALLKRCSAVDVLWFCERPFRSARSAERHVGTGSLLADSRESKGSAFSAGVRYGLSEEKEGWYSARVWTSALPLRRALSDEAERLSHDLSSGFVDQVQSSSMDELAGAVAAMLSVALANRSRGLRTVNVRAVCRRAPGLAAEVITVPVSTTSIALSKGHTEVYGGVLLERKGIEVLSAGVSLSLAEMAAAGYNAALSTAGDLRLKNLLRTHCHITDEHGLTLAAEQLFAQLKAADDLRAQAKAGELRRAVSELHAYCSAQGLPFGSVSEMLARPGTTEAQSVWIRDHGRRMDVLRRASQETAGVSRVERAQPEPA